MANLNGINTPNSNTNNPIIENGHVTTSYSECLSSSSLDALLIPIGDPEPSPPKFPKEPKKLFVRSFLFLC